MSAERVAELEAEVAELRAQLGAAAPRARIDRMSAEVKDSNPYR